MKGHIRELGKNHWEIFVDLRRGPDRKRKQTSKTIHGKRSEADAMLRKMLSEVDAGLSHDSSTSTVGQFLRRWLDDVAKVSVTPATFEKYEEAVDKHLTPALGHIKLTDPQPSDVQAVYARWQTSGRRDKKKGGFAAATIRKHHAVLRQALQTALQWSFVTRNVATFVRLPRSQQESAKRHLSPVECWLLLAEAKGSRVRTPLLVLLETGMRRGELLALRWQDLDVKAGRLRIQRSLECTTSLGLRFKSPKSGKSRVISLSEQAVAALEAHRDEQWVEREKCVEVCGTYAAMDLVFPMPWGEPWDPRAFSLAFRRIAATPASEASGRTRCAIRRRR